MKIQLLTISLFTLLNHALAQNADALIHAEKAFEKTCLEKGIRDGFLANVDSNAIIFTAKGPSSAKQFWSSLPVLEGVYTWSPTYAEMSVSGDWGYTSGNFEHRPKTMADTANEWGQYNTIWHKTGNGDWKYLIDMGSPHPPASLETQTQTIQVKKISDGKNASTDKLMDLEKHFIVSYQKNIENSYQKYGSENYILTLSGNAAVTSTATAVSLFNNLSPSLNFQPAGLYISPGKDMAVVYGSLEQGGKPGNYMRVWRHENTGWKIALEVIHL